jgi:hypothetical protein
VLRQWLTGEDGTPTRETVGDLAYKVMRDPRAVLLLMQEVIRLRMRVEMLEAGETPAAAPPNVSALSDRPTVALVESIFEADDSGPFDVPVLLCVCVQR